MNEFIREKVVAVALEKDGFEPITLEETDRLVALEGLIEKNVLAVAEALREIKESRLYRSKYATFEAYIKGRWGKSKGWAYRQIQFLVDVEKSPQGDVPKTEKAARKARSKPTVATNGSESEEEKATNNLIRGNGFRRDQAESLFDQGAELLNGNGKVISRSWPSPQPKDETLAKLTLHRWMEEVQCVLDRGKKSLSTDDFISGLHVILDKVNKQLRR